MSESGTGKNAHLTAGNHVRSRVQSKIKTELIEEIGDSHLICLAKR
jgi:hypothetical protein